MLNAFLTDPHPKMPGRDNATLIEKLLFISKPTHEHYVRAEGPDA